MNHQQQVEELRKKKIISGFLKFACVFICFFDVHNFLSAQPHLKSGKPAIIADADTVKEFSLPWDTTELFKIPKTYPSRLCRLKGFKAFFYEGLVYKARKTRVFAYYKMPAGKAPAGGWPAVVCIHGGGGTAFPEWVQAWVDHGYAAISMDLEGHLPIGEFPNRQWHEYAGPPRITTFGDIEIADHEQWFYHAVADVVKAVSLLGSYPEINKNEIGIHGISWGGVIASAVSGIDHRIAFAVPVYGCGFLYETTIPSFKKYFDVMTKDQLAAYKSKWDPSLYLVKNKMPTFFYTGSNDQAFSLDIWQKSARLTKGPRMLCVPVTDEHGHIWNQKEIFSFADAVTKKNWPLFNIEEPELVDGTATTRIFAYNKSVKFRLTSKDTAQLIYTKDTGNFQARRWQSIPAEIKADTILSSLPPSTTAFYFNLVNSRGLVFSSPYKQVN